MSEKFSAALRIGDLNDFIAPSQACIVSLKGLKKNDKPEVFSFPSLHRNNNHNTFVKPFLFTFNFTLGIKCYQAGQV